MNVSLPPTAGRGAEGSSQISIISDNDFVPSPNPLGEGDNVRYNAYIKNKNCIKKFDIAT